MNVRPHIDTAVPVNGRPGPRAGVLRAAIVLGAFTALTAVLFWPWIAHLDTALLGPPEDNMQDFWNTWYAAVAHGPDFFRTRLLHWPAGVDLRFQSFAYPQVFAVVLLSNLFGTGLPSLVALQNLTILASFPLAATAAFYLVRHVTKSDAGGAVGGFIFAFSPWHVAMAMHHAHVASIEFIPAFVLSYLLAIERRSPAWLAAAAVFYALSALMCWYFLFYIAYFIAFHFLWLLFRRHRVPEGWDRLAPAATLGGCAILIAPLAVPMALRSFGARVYAGGTNAFVADLAAYVAPPPTHLLGGWTTAFYARLSGNPWEATVYVGIVTIAVLAWWYARQRKADPLANYVLAGIVTFCIIATGDCLHVAGQSTILHSPALVLSKLPFFANVRTPSRAIVMVYLFISLGMGSAVALLLDNPSRLRRYAGAVVAALVFADFYPAHIAGTPVSCDPGFAVLRNDPAKDFGILDLPTGYAEQNAAMLGQVCHGRPLAGGNTTRGTPGSLVSRAYTAGVSHQKALLERTHIKYIVVHAPQGKLYKWNAADGSRARLFADYATVYRDGRLAILRVY